MAAESKPHSVLDAAKQYLDEVGEFPSNRETHDLIRGLVEQLETLVAAWDDWITNGDPYGGPDFDTGTQRTSEALEEAFVRAGWNPAREPEAS